MADSTASNGTVVANGTPAIATSSPPAVTSATADATSSTSAAAAQWTDITARFHAIVTQLPVGQLVHHPSFGLRDAMNALELGDPKMDAMMHIPKNVMSIERGLSEGLIVEGSKLTPFQILEVIDELLACEATSYSGSSLVHTIYTCLYLHRLSMLRESCPLLCTYLLFVLKNIELVRQIIIQAELYNDEDFTYAISHVIFGEMNMTTNYRNGFSTAAKPPVDPNQPVKPLEKEDQPYAGWTIEELLLQFTLQEKSIETKLTELRALAQTEATTNNTPLPNEADLLCQPATPDSSELHIYLLLQNRFTFRRSWYYLNLLLRQEPYHLKTRLQRVQQYEVILNSSLEIMSKTMRGSSWRIEEEKRKQSEVEYKKSVNDKITAYEADPTHMPKPDFPKPPPPYLQPRPLTFGFHADMTKSLIQTSPPRILSILYRRDAVDLFREFMSHYSLLADLPPLATQQTFFDVLNWFIQFHYLKPNILLRSHIYLWMTLKSKTVDVEKMVPVANDFLEFILDNVPLSHAAAIPKKREQHDNLHHDNTKELLIKAHLKRYPSMEHYAHELLAAEAARKLAGERPKLWNPAKEPFTYSVFLDRSIIPFFNLFKTLLVNSSEYRKRILQDGACEFSDWNILIHDALHVDQKEWAAKYLVEEEQAVAIPPNYTPELRAQHPALYYPYNCYMMIRDVSTEIAINYVVHGLESALYTPKELPYVFWFLHSFLDLRINSHYESYRDRKDLLALRAPLKKLTAKSKSHYNKLKLLPPGQRPPPPPTNWRYLCAEAQLYLVRALMMVIEGMRRLTFEKITSEIKEDAAEKKEQTKSIIIPSIDDDLVSRSGQVDILTTWYSHRFAALRIIHWPHPLTLKSYLEDLLRIAPVKCTPLQLIHLSQTSFLKAKEFLTLIDSQFIQPKTRLATNPHLNPFEVAHITALSNIVRANLALSLEMTKVHATITKRQQPMKLRFQWDSYPTTFQSQTTQTRLVPLPILQLAEDHMEKKGE